MNLYLESMKVLERKKEQYVLEDENKPFDSVSFVLLMLAVMKSNGINSISLATIERDISKCCMGEEFDILTENIYKIEPDHLDLALGMSKLDLFKKAYESKKNPIIKIDMEDDFVKQVLAFPGYTNYLPLMEQAVTKYKEETVGPSKIKTLFAKKRH